MPESSTEPTRHCPRCNSPRRAGQCWKCGAVTCTVSSNWIYPKLPPVDEIRLLAKDMGYALAVHGSLERDLDLVAVPWTQDAVEPEELIDYLCRKLRGEIRGGIETKPHGRIAVNIKLDGWFKLIDLSITRKCDHG